MTWTLRTLVVAACLIAATTAQDYDYGLEDPETKLLVDPAIKDFFIVLAVKGVIIAGIVIGLIVLFRTYALGIAQRVVPGVGLPTDVERIDTFVFDDEDYTVSDSDSYYGHPTLQRSLRAGGSLLTRVLDSIDPVESTFAMLQVEEVACRRRTVCEVQRAASRMPLLGSVLQYFSPSVTGLEEYKEAQDAGAALEDCALLFSECPTSLVQTLWGEEQ
nr:uncharacterized protein LOC123768861 isoform X1 [Procambarus clarkii]